MAKKSIPAIKASLLKQLKEIGGLTPHFESLVEDYCNIEKRERALYKAMETYSVTDANGLKITQIATNLNKQKMAILKQLGLTTSNVVSEGDDKL